MSETDNVPETDAIAETTSVDNQPADVTATNADQAGAPEANQPAATDSAPVTTDTRSEETPEQLLERIAPGNLSVNVPARVTDPASANPYQHLSQDFQKRLGDPREAQRLENLDKVYGRQAQEIGQLRQQVQQYQGLPPAEQLRAQHELAQRQAEIANRKPWDSRHPEH